MLSVLLGETPDLMKNIADFYFPSALSILDVSYGNGLLSSKLKNVSTVDIDPGSAADIEADSCDLPLEDGSFDAAIFDPPYLYGRKTQAIQGRPTWDASRSENALPSDFIERAEGTARELCRVLEPGGIAVTKVADARLKGQLVLNHLLIIEAFSNAGLPLRDLLVYVRTGGGVFKNARSAQNAHGYFVVSQKQSAMEMDL